MAQDPKLRTKQDFLAAMDPRQLACRFRHSFPPLLGPKLPEGFDAVPMQRAGVMLITETCPVCTTQLRYETGSDGIFDPDVRSRTQTYVYPEWWIHVVGSRGADGERVKVTMGDCRRLLWQERAREIRALAKKHRGAAA